MPSLDALIALIGVFGIAGIVFAESGILIGFFLPGDSLLVTAGLLASQGYLNIWALLPLTIIAAILGDSVGYATGRFLGQKIFKENARFFKKEYVARTEQFFKNHGSWAIVLARFIPIIRTGVPVMAGVGKMEYRTFVIYNCIGGVAWAGGILGLAYAAGKYIPGISEYVDYIIIGVVIISLIPLIKHARGGRGRGE